MVSPRDQIPQEELRLALVLNGGVSLAVWMGGTVREIDDLVRAGRRPAGGPSGRYDAVLDLARTWASVDVIAGTSAGGINGACLALSQANRNADLGALRDLWAEQGRIDSLLRRPFVGQPTSLLRGDEYFLPELTRAMAGLVSDFEPTDNEIDLSITTTLLHGALSVTTDGLGQQLPQRRHGACFRFSTSKELGREDDFAAERIATTATAMALAARSTAGFPFAFEPSFVPVAEESSRRARRAPEEPPGVDRVDMEAWASWARDGDADAHTPGRDRSRFTLDGGVLANTPTRHALDAIDRRPARNPVRRQLLLVFPHAPSVDPDLEKADPPDLASETPEVTDSVGGLLAALTSQGSLTFVEEIEAHNRQAARWRGGRRQVLEHTPLETIYELVESAWRHYHWIRTRTAARVLADRVPRPKGWSYQRVVDEAHRGQQEWPGRTGEPLPYVPRTTPREQVASWSGDDWSWGTTVALGIADSAGEILLNAQSVASREESGPLAEALRRMSTARDTMLTERDAFDHAWWHLPGIRDVVPDSGYWQLRLLCYRTAMLGQDDARLREELLRSLRRADGNPVDARTMAAALDEQLPEAAGKQTATAVKEVLEALLEVSDVVVRIAGDDARGPLTPLGPWAEILDPEPLDLEPADPRERLLARLLTLDAATWLLADADSPGTSQEISLAQLSLGIDHHFPKVSTTPEDKVAGTELSRFGGFLKRSWRINDWTWGRLDAAQMLCRLVLNPDRLRRIHALSRRPAEELAREMVDGLVESSYTGGAAPTDPAFQGLRDRATRELTRLFEGDPRVVALGYLPHLAHLAAHPVQQRIIVEELPALVAATRADLNDGGNPRCNGARFLAEHADLLARVGAAGPEGWQQYGDAALAAFDRAGIGREPLEEEARSDAFIRTAITTAASVITLADSDRFGVKVIKPVTKVVRGAALVPYWLVTGLTSGSSAARSLALLGFTVGGVLLALSLLGVLGGLSSAGAAIGTGTTLGALAFAALRSGTFLHGVVLLGPVVPLIALAAPLGADDAADTMAEGPVTSVVTVLGIALGLILLASLPNPMRSPASALRSSYRRGALTRFAMLLAAAAVVVGVVAFVATRPDGARWSVEHLLSWPPVWLSAVISIVAVGIAALGGWLLGRGLRLWRREPASGWVLEEHVSHPAGVSAGWAAVYGVVYLGLAWGGWLLAEWRHGDLLSAPGWLVATIVWCAALGLGLSLLGPLLVVRIDRRRIAARIADARKAVGGQVDGLLDLLERRGLLFSYLTTASRDEKRRRQAAALHLDRRRSGS